MTREVLAAHSHAGNVVLDVDGCLHVDGEAIPGAGAALRELEAEGFLTLIATNNSTRHRSTVADEVTRIVGATIPIDRVITSGLAVVTMIDPARDAVLVVGEDGLYETLTDAGISLTDEPGSATAVVVGLDRSFDYDKMRRAVAAVRSGARFIATNEDATFPTGGVPEPGAGAIVASIERAAGVVPEYAGKPHEPMLSAIAARLGPGRTWVVGDRIDTDIALAKRAAWASVLVMTGVTESRAAIPPGLEPDHVVDSVAALPALLARRDA